MKESLYIPLPDRSLIEISGNDREKFLQGIITNDIKKVDKNTAIYSCLLTPQGKFLFDFFIAEINGRYMIDCGASRADELKKRLLMYKLRSDIKIEYNNKYEVVAVLGKKIFKEADQQQKEGAAKVFSFIDPRTPRMFARSIIDKENHYQSFEAKGFSKGEFKEYEELRIKTGVPDGEKDLTPDKSFPLQYKMDEFLAIDFKKGCYVGQEVTARSKHRGVIRKSLFTVTSEQAIPEAGTPVIFDGKQVGELKSSIGNNALALLEIEQAKKALENNAFLEARDTALKII